MDAVDPLDRFFSCVEALPDRPAVIARDGAISYGAFGERVRRIAAALVRDGEAPRVLIHLPQGADAYASMFATLMAGGVYAPVNVEAPAERQALIASEFEADVVVTDAAGRSRLGAIGADGTVLAIESIGDEALDAPRPTGELAYVIFTSGSTGTPKGVMIARQALAHYVAWALPALGIGADDRCSQHPNIGFDLSVLDIYASLCSGAALAPFAGADDRLVPARAVQRHGLTVWISVPSVIDLMAKAGQVTAGHLGSLRLLFFCGEPLLPRHLEAIFAALPEVSVINAYGPTEATVSCTELRLAADSYREACGDSVALGDAIPGMSLDLVGGDRREEGEIMLSGPQLARGYWRNETLTAESFRPVPGTDTVGYFTGDWARVRDGHLYFQERMDRQVKIHGYRLELAEVDAALERLGVPAAFTVLAEGRLVSFVEAGGQDGPATLRRSLAAWLPAYAMPAEIRVLSALPRNANGKIDGQRLKGMVAGDRG